MTSTERASRKKPDDVKWFHDIMHVIPVILCARQMSCPMAPCDAVAKRFEYHYAAVLDMYDPGIGKSHSAIVWLMVPVTTSRSAIYYLIL